VAKPVIFYGTFKYAHTKMKPSDWTVYTVLQFWTNCRYHEIQTLLSFHISVTTRRLFAGVCYLSHRFIFQYKFWLKRKYCASFQNDIFLS